MIQFFGLERRSLISYGYFMVYKSELNTARLLLRSLDDADKPAYAAMNADPEVRRFFPNVLTKRQSNAEMDRFLAMPQQGDWAPYGVELLGQAGFIGFVGCWRIRPELPIAPGIEIGWRLARPYWGQGLASEAAQAVCTMFFEQEGRKVELLSYTAALNVPSQRVMQKIGMREDPTRAFEHPLAPKGHPLRPHIVYVMGS